MLHALINNGAFEVIVFTCGLLAFAAMRCTMSRLILVIPTQQQTGSRNDHLNRLTSIYAPEAGKEDYFKAPYYKNPSALFCSRQLQGYLRKICS